MNGANMPAPNSPFLDGNGRVTPAWYALLLTLVTPTAGGGTGSSLAVLQEEAAQIPGLVTGVATLTTEVTHLNVVQKSTRGAAWSGGGSPIATPTDDISITCPNAGTITQVVILTKGGPGACQIGVWKVPFASFPPTIANTITGSDIPQITAGISYSDTTLTGWTTSVNAGDVIAFHLASSSAFTTIEILLTIQA